MPRSTFDPDRLELTKPEIVGFCDRVLARWGKEPAKNAHGIMAMNAVRAGVMWTDDESLKAIWGEIVKWSFEIMYENALAQAKDGDVDWAGVMRGLKSKK